MEKIGQGTFREVFTYPDNPEQLVVKVPRQGAEKYGRIMNQEEHRAAQLYPDLFPAVHNSDWDALVVDRADTFQGSPGDMPRFFPGVQRVIEIGSVKDPWLLLREMLRLHTGKTPIHDARKEFGLRRKVIARIAGSDPTLSELADAVKNLEIDIKDITEMNTGVSRRTGKFVLVDASTMAGFRG
jgi:hypothetical protein